ncbi:MAG: DUF4097 family beta strand repeat-containing protein [Chloroflexota bacterium]
MTDATRTTDPTVRELPLAAGDLELKLGANRVRVRITDGDRVVIRSRSDHDLERDVEITSGEELGPRDRRPGWLLPPRAAHGPQRRPHAGPRHRGAARGPHQRPHAVGVDRGHRPDGAESLAVGQRQHPHRRGRGPGDHRDHVGRCVRRRARGDRADRPHGVGHREDPRPRILALDAATTSGDITVDAALDAGAIHHVTSVSGDVRLITGSEVNVDFQSVAGEAKASMPHRIDGARGRRTVVVGSGRVKVEVKTMSGDVKLKPGEPDLAPEGEAGATAPKATFWADFGRDWAESAKEWAGSWKDWGQSWAAGKAWASTTPPTPPAPPTPASPATPPTPPTPPTPFTPASDQATDPAPAEPDPVRDGQPGPAPVAEPEAVAAADDEAPGPDAALDETATAPVAPASHADVEAARLDVLRALERGELDVEAAAERLAALEGLGRGEA